MGREQPAAPLGKTEGEERENEERRGVVACLGVGRRARRHHNYHHRRSNKITIIIIIIISVVAVVVIGLKSWASMLERSRSLAPMLLFRVGGIGRPRQISLSPSLFVLFSGIISVKDEDVVACGNFHLVVIRSFARSLSRESLRFSTAPPPLFRLCSLRPTKIAPHYHQDHFCRNGGERTGQTQRGAIEANDRRSSCCGRRAGVIFAIAGNGLFS